MKLSLLKTAAIMLAAAGVASGALAQEVTLKAASAFQEGTYFARNFERFVKKVNEEGKGLVQINYIGGPKAIPAFEQGNALRSGVVDISNNTTSFLAGIIPEGLALTYTNHSMADMRKSGAFDYVNKIFMDKGLYYFARTTEGVRYHIYINKKIDKADFTGVKLRIAPVYRDFFQAVGANVVQVAPGEVYTSLERGVVDGYGWPMMGIFDLGWQEKTKFRIEPGFYSVEVGAIFNLNSWKKLTPEQRAFLNKQAVWLESQNAELAAKDIPAEVSRQQQAGIQVIKFDAVQSALLIKKANDAAWDAVVKSSPAHGAKLREMLAPK